MDLGRPTFAFVANRLLCAQAASAEVVKRALSRSSSKIDLIYSKESFANEFGNVLSRESQLSATDFDVLLLYLSRDVGAIAYDGEVGEHFSIFCF